MENKKEYRILLVRNECSAMVDDLVSSVTNSALASELRNISEEIMALDPRFLLDHRLATELRHHCKTTLKQYEQKQIKDVDLVTFISNTRTILKSNKEQHGGKKMSFLKTLFQSKEARQQQNLENLLQMLETTQSKIEKTETKMKQCVEACRGLPRNSATYRIKAQEYTIAKSTLTVLQEEAEKLLQTKANYEKAGIIRGHKDRLAEIGKGAAALIGKPERLDGTIAEIDILTEKTETHIGEINDITSKFFEDMENGSSQSFSSSDFDAEVAEAEHRHDLLEIDGSLQKTGSSNPEFDSLVDANNRSEQK